jgi:rod shape-determining protein MreD
MPQNNSYTLVYFVLSISVAMVLRTVLLKPELNDFNPDWVLLALIYWSMALPERIGVFSGWFIGLLVDVLTGRALGQYALVYALMSYFSVKMHRQLRQYPIIQQCVFVFFCLLLGQALMLLTETLQGAARFHTGFWWPVVTGTLAWPLVFWGLRWLRVLAHIA